MHKIIQKISAAVQIVLMAPIKLPGKAMSIIKYVALGLGIIESVLDKEKSDEVTSNRVTRDGEAKDEVTSHGPTGDEVSKES